jgi:hypothetical protein
MTFTFSIVPKNVDFTIFVLSRSTLLVSWILDIVSCTLVLEHLGFTSFFRSHKSDIFDIDINKTCCSTLFLAGDRIRDLTQAGDLSFSFSIFWIMTSCALAGGYRRFCGTYRIHLQLWKAQSTSSPLWEPEIWNSVSLSKFECLKFE